MTTNLRGSGIAMTGFRASVVRPGVKVFSTKAPT